MVIKLSKKMKKLMASTKESLNNMDSNIEKIKGNPYSLLMGIKQGKIKIRLGSLTCESDDRDIKITKKYLDKKIKMKENDSKYIVIFGYPTQKQLDSLSKNGLKLLACIVYKQDQANYIPVNLAGIEMHELDDAFITMAVSMYNDYGLLSENICEVIRCGARGILLEDTIEYEFNLFDNITNPSNLDEIESVYLDGVNRHWMADQHDFRGRPYDEYDDSHIFPLASVKDEMRNDVNIFLIDKPIEDFHRMQAKQSMFYGYRPRIYSGEENIDAHVIISMITPTHLRAYILSERGYQFILSKFKYIALQNGAIFDIYFKESEVLDGSISNIMYYFKSHRDYYMAYNVYHEHDRECKAFIKKINADIYDRERY